MAFRYEEQLSRPERRRTNAPTVVLVDDDKRVVELLEVALSGAGYRTFSAYDGDEALAVIKKVKPDVVVLDLRLPKRNGFQVCEALRSNPGTKTIPVIMISGLVEPSARVQGLRCGADDFLTKPFSPKELLLRMQKILFRASEAQSRAKASAQAERELMEKQKHLNLARRRLAARLDRVGAVSEMGRTMAGVETLEELADQLIISVQFCLRAGIALIALRDEARAEYKIFRSRGLSSRCARNIALPVDCKLCSSLTSQRGSMTLEELDCTPGMREEIVPLRAAGLAMGSAVEGRDGPSALIFVGPGLDGAAFIAEERGDFESLCRFFGTGLKAIQRAEAERAVVVDTVEMLMREKEGSGDCRGGHSCRVARFVESIWESLDLPPYELQNIRLAALLHELEGVNADTGKSCSCSGVDLDAACAGGCTDETQCSCRPEIPECELPPNLRSLMQYCGERYDGSGGPFGLRAEQIPLEARILAVADTFDECLHSCGSASPVDQAIRSLRRLSGKSLDPNLVEALVRHILSGRVRLG